MTTTQLLQLESFESVKRWETRLNRKSGSLNTRSAFLGWLPRFCAFVGDVDPDKLVSERQDDLKSEDVFVRKRAEDRLDRWFSELEKQGYARNTCVQAYAAIRSFYKANHLPLETGEPVQGLPVKEQREFTREHLRQLLDVSKKDKQRAIVMCQAIGRHSTWTLCIVTNLSYSPEQLIASRLGREKRFSSLLVGTR